jgi:outer membrane protein TolC
MRFGLWLTVSIAFTCVLLPAAGCSGPYGYDSVYADKLRQDLGLIEPVNLTDMSRSKPVSVEEGTEDLAERVLGRPALAPLSITLEDVRVAALANNLGLKVDLVTPAIASEELAAQKAKFEPSFTGFMQYQRDREESRGNSFKTSGLLGVAAPLWTGGQIVLDVPVEYEQGEDVDDAYSTALRASISQPLLRNAGVKVNTASIRIAGARSIISDAQARLDVIRTLAEADRRYWGLYAARRELDIVDQQYQIALKQLDTAEKMVRAGAAPKIEIIRAQAGLPSRLGAIVVANADLLTAQRDLKRLMNRDDLPVESDVPIEIGTRPNPLGLDLDRSALIARALSERAELLKLEQQMAIDDELILLQQSALLPAVNLAMSYAAKGTADRLDRALDRSASRSSSGSFAGLTVDVPIGNRTAEARLREARLARLRVELEKGQEEQFIRQEVCDALDLLHLNWQLILTACQGTVIADLKYQAERKQFELGRRTSTDVLDAATSLAAAQLTEVQAMAAYEIAKINLAVSTGTLLGHDGVSWEMADAEGQVSSPRPSMRGSSTSRRNLRRD